jgi:hypothetical protein
MDYPKESLKPAKFDISFILAFYGLQIVVSISNIFAYLKNPLYLIIGVSLPLGNSLGTFGISLLVSHIPSVKLSEDALNLIFYLTTGLSLIFSDSNILNQFTSSSTPASLPSLISLIYLSLLGPRKLVKDKKIYLLSTFFLSTTSFLLNLFGSQRQDLTVFQFIILLKVFILSSSKCKSSSFTFSRSVFIAYDEQSKNSAKNTPLDEVLEKLEKITEKMGEILTSADNDLRGSAEFCLTALKRVFHQLATTKNIYEVNFSIMDKLDTEEKKFIEQNFCQMEAEDKKGDYKIAVFQSETLYGADQLSGLLKQIGTEWNFDVFFVKDLSGNQAIQVCSVFLLKKYGLVQTLKLKSSQLQNFVEEIEKRYFSNPYHNNTHGADVMCSFLYLLNSFQVFEFLSGVDLLACIVACLAHDVGHQAKNNRFLVVTRNDLAITYNDVSVLEMMHASTVFELLKLEKFDFFPNHFESFPWFRKVIIEMVLATDMAKYFDQLSSFKSKYLNDSFSLEVGDTRLDFFKILIKCADVGHSAKKIELHEKWCWLIMEEFFAQGDMEKSMNLSVSMFCDRNSTNVPKSQAGFIRNIVSPVFLAVNSVRPSQLVLENCIKQLEANVEYWESKNPQKNQTEGFDSERCVLVVPHPGFNPRRGSMPLIFA